MLVAVGEALHLGVLLQPVQIKPFLVAHRRPRAVELLRHSVEASARRIRVVGAVATALIAVTPDDHRRMVPVAADKVGMVCYNCWRISKIAVFVHHHDTNTIVDVKRDGLWWIV